LKEKSLKQRIGSWLIPHLPMTRELFDQNRYEWNSFIVNVLNCLNPLLKGKIRKLSEKKDLSLNIGAGPFGEAGWINLDLAKHQNIAFRYDCRKKIPFPDASVARIRVEHFLEHLDIKQQTPQFLSHCYRVLKPGGIIRIVVPDIEKLILAYTSNSADKWLECGWDINHLPEEFDTPLFILNHTFRQDGEHKFAFDFETLEIILKKFGFSKVIKQEFGKSIDERLKNDLPNHQKYSLYVEAIR